MRMCECMDMQLRDTRKSDSLDLRKSQCVPDTRCCGNLQITGQVVAVNKCACYHIQGRRRIEKQPTIQTRQVKENAVKRLEQATAEEIDVWADRVLEANSLDQVFDNK